MLKTILLLPLLIILYYPVYGQQADSSSLKFSGYIQAEYQSAQQNGIRTFEGGDFNTNIRNRFLVRRGRLKVTYKQELSEYVLQFDATDKGFTLKDAYAQITEPWLKTFSLRGGIFNRPFGFEIAYSSSNRESPERSRMFQTLFPGERDLGAQIEIAPHKELGLLSHFNLQAGVFSGNGPNPETDNAKDFIGRLGFNFANNDFGFSGGVSGYFGSVRLDDKHKTYTINNANSVTVDSSKEFYERTYAGFDLQFKYAVPVLGDMVLRGEYIQGKNPGTFDSNFPYKAGSGDIYERDFNGYYIIFVQNIGKSNQFVAKYDVFNPDKNISSNDIGSSNPFLSAADLTYKTFGIGWLYHWDKNVKFTLYYDFVTNEKVNSSAAEASLKPYTNELKDNVLTLRMQVKF